MINIKQVPSIYMYDQHHRLAKDVVLIDLKVRGPKHEIPNYTFITKYKPLRSMLKFTMMLQCLKYRSSSFVWMWERFPHTKAENRHIITYSLLTPLVVNTY